MVRQLGKWGYPRVILCSGKLLLPVLALILTSCVLKYKNVNGKYRPRNPDYTVVDNSVNVKQLDTVGFNVKWCYDAYFENYDGRLLRDVWLFSNDGRFATLPSYVQEKSSSLILNADPWSIGEQVGFFIQKGDTLMIEYFANFSWGKYYTIQAVLKDGSLRVVNTWQGIGKSKVLIKESSQRVLRRINNVILTY